MNKIIGILVSGIVTVAFLAAFPIMTYSQTEPPVKPAFPVHNPRVPAPVMDGALERSIKVESGVNVSLCVTEGTVKVNGWNRNELRVFVQDGSKFGFKVLQKNEKTGDPVWVMVMGIETKKKYASSTECISGGEIEIDLPKGATVNLKGKEITAAIDSIRKVDAQTAGGDISVRNIANGITASTYQGDVTVEESKGPMILETTTGNVLVFEAGPSEIGDMFKAKTNGGAISLQRLEYRQMDVNSISGSVTFNGEILSGGSYSMSTSNGSIRLSIPLKTSCKINATYSSGSISSEIPFKLLTETIEEWAKNVVVALGDGGDATVKLVTHNGSISIKKQ